MLGHTRLKGKRAPSGAAQRPGLKRSLSLGKLKRALSRGELSRELSRSGSFSNWAVDVPAAQALLTGLREMRAERLLCDVALVAGERSFPAHQAVLAAASEPLRELFVGGSEAGGEALPAPPAAMRLQLQGLGEPEVVEALLDHVYQGATSASLGKDPHGLRGLSAALAMPSLDPRGAPANAKEGGQTLARKLRHLRSSGCLCDFVFVAAGERMPAHQVVLAAASVPLCAYILQGLNEAAAETSCAGNSSASSSGAPTAPTDDGPASQGTSEPVELPEVTSEPMELEIQGISHADALHTVLQHVYGAPDVATRFRPLSEEGQWDVLRLATAFELPALREHAAEWLREGADAANLGIRLQVCDELGLSALKAELLRKVGGALSSAITARHAVGSSSPASSPAPAPAPASAPASALCSTPEGSQEALDWLLKQAEPSDSGSVAGPARRMKRRGGKQPRDAGTPSAAARPRDADTPSAAEEVADLSASLMAVPSARFCDARVPCQAPDSVWASDAARRTSPRQDEKLLKQLWDAFTERPVWLQGPLEQRLSQKLSIDALTRQLSKVAYQWSDGPWHTAFARHGWDPRQHPEEAKWLQVLDFRDPAFRRSGRRTPGASPDASCTVDHNFRQPPTLRTQLYQFIDIRDKVVKELIGESEPSDQCSHKTGWLDGVVYEAAHERLVLRSQQLRERQSSGSVEKAQQRTPIRHSEGADGGADSRGRAAAVGNGAGRGAKTCPAKRASGSGTPLSGARRDSAGSGGGGRLSGSSRRSGSQRPPAKKLRK